MARIHEDHNHILCNPLLACVQTIYIPFIHLPPDKTMSTSQHFLSSNIRIAKIVPRSKIRFCTLQIPFHGVQTIPNTDILAYLCSYDGSGQLTNCFSFSLCKLLFVSWCHILHVGSISSDLVHTMTKCYMGT